MTQWVGKTVQKKKKKWRYQTDQTQKAEDSEHFIVIDGRSMCHSLMDCFPNFTDVGGKPCSLLVLRRRDSLTLAQCQSQHKCLLMWESPNSFLSSSLSTLNICLAPFSQFPVCFMCIPTLEVIWESSSIPLPPLYTKARSQTQLTNMVNLANQLTLGNPISLDFSSWYYRWDIMTIGFPHTWFTH